MKLLALDPPVTGLADPTIYLARDRFVAGAIHPGLAEKLTLAWEVPIDAALPDKIRLSVGSQIYKNATTSMAHPTGLIATRLPLSN